MTSIMDTTPPEEPCPVYLGGRGPRPAGSGGGKGLVCPGKRETASDNWRTWQVAKKLLENGKKGLVGKLGRES